MYLSYAWHGAVRGMDIQTRAAKFSELWKQLLWLENNMGRKFLAGEEVCTHVHYQIILHSTCTHIRLLAFHTHVHTPADFLF